MTADMILLAHDEERGIATITLNDPDRNNPFSRQLVAELQDALNEAEALEPRCLVVEGAGPAFSAGGDIELMKETIEGDITPHERVRGIEQQDPALRDLKQFPAPTVAKVDGAAAGAGANLAIACDLVLASERASIGFAFRNVGLNVDGGTSGLLPHIVGEKLAKELTFTGEQISAARANDIGLFNRTYPTSEFDERADAFINEHLASGPTVALNYTKKLIDGGFKKSFEQAQEDEAVYQAACVDTHDHEEGVRGFLEKREPRFEGQ
jgi:2-(1,2-epoxy-1,2-dihydrophenyl)acetyl-CoA isomerase